MAALELGESGADGLDGLLLEADVEARGDAEAARREQLGRIGALELAAHEVDEVGRRVARRRARRTRHRFGERRAILLLGDRPVVAQQAENDVAAGAGTLR